MSENYFFNIFCLTKLINSILSQSWLKMCSRSAMKKIYAKYSSDGITLCNTVGCITQRVILCITRCNIEQGKGNHPQATRKMRKTEADNIFAEG